MFRRNRKERVLMPDGSIAEIQKYSEWNRFLKAYDFTDFCRHCVLFKNQIGVYRFNVNGEPFYIGYSCDLATRVPISFFNHCFGWENVTFQYILCDSKEEAIKVESHYITLFQPTANYVGKNKDHRIDNAPEFCNEMQLLFNQYWNARQ